jgi:rfaE bifunctional protein nucleotidyltransferase chain/domain
MNPLEKIITLNFLKDIRPTLFRVVGTNGTFDIMHCGHAEYLYQARTLGSHLVVGLNDDDSVRDLKGPNRPICGVEDRAYMLASLEAVDYVVVFSSPRCTNFLKVLRPDIYVKGGDYTLKKLDPDERRVLKASRSKIIFIPLVPERSTTTLISRIKTLN